MPIDVKISAPELKRFVTGLHSLDRALGFKGEYGMPLGSMVELYGKWESGKTTLALYLAGKVNPKGRIVVGDLEGSMKEDYIVPVLEQAGFEGAVEVVSFQDEKKKLRTHEEVAKLTADALLEDDVYSVILDSVGAFQPVVERQGDIEEAFMGKRAQAMSKYSRRTAAWLRTELESGNHKMSFLINHVLTKMGTRGKTTPGGDAIKFLSRVRMLMGKAYRSNSAVYAEDDGFLAELKITKLTFGGSYGERTGYVFIIPGLGVSPDMTAVFDCLFLDLVKKERGRIKVPYVVTGEEEWKSIGTISELIGEVRAGKTTKFKRLYELLEGVRRE